MTSASSGFGYAPQSVCTNDLGGAQMPSAWPSAHLSGMVPGSAAGAGSAVLGGAGSAGAADAGGAVLAGSLEGPPPDEAPPQAAARMTIAGKVDRFMAVKRTTNARRS